jgi:hypothetical protein
MNKEAIRKISGNGFAVRMIMNEYGIHDEKWEFEKPSKFCIVVSPLDAEKYLPDDDIEEHFNEETLLEFKDKNMKLPLIQRKNVHIIARESFKKADKTIYYFDDYKEATIKYKELALSICKKTVGDLHADLKDKEKRIIGYGDDK